MSAGGSNDCCAIGVGASAITSTPRILSVNSQDGSLNEPGADGLGSGTFSIGYLAAPEHRNIIDQRAHRRD
ncbi:hypothetical protein CBM2595_A70047 [Cupriavidus taiwanensis]|nr:hypothetical protein CBM2595_A70047 [Cupriavidus taiwanensis]